jgi:glutamate-1-semialdehyde 2,1-aminomutase
MIEGGSHSNRLWRPYPFFAASAEGAAVRDVDGNTYIDYWQGHYANILGHNPKLIRREIAACLGRGALHTGFEASHQIELAETLVRELGGKETRVRFTTSGTLATMYAVMLAQGLTGIRRYGEHGERLGEELAVFVNAFAPPPRPHLLPG